jgi:hypothetical protein
MSGFDVNSVGHELDRLQRWMQSIVTHPGGVSSGVASGDARKNIDINLEDIESIVAPSATLSGQERLAIYCRSYHARLLECFREMFPALFRALGEELFNLFALDYLQRHPPQSYTLDHLADAFAEYLAETRPGAKASPGEREDWPDFICELASLEWNFLKIYDGPGVEGRPSPRAQELLSIPVERVFEVRSVLAACLRLFSLRYPVHRFMLAVRRGENPEIPALSPTFVAATRLEYRVKLHELSAPQYLFLKALTADCHSVGAATDQVAKLNGVQLLPGAIQNWLGDWIAEGFFESVQVVSG